MADTSPIAGWQRAWSAALDPLARVARRGGSLGNRERRALRQAATACSAVLAGLAGLGDDREAARVAGELAEVVQPRCSRLALVEELFRMRDGLASLAGCEAGLERLALDGAQLAWLHAILTARCRDLARVPAGPRRRAIALGS